MTRPSFLPRTALACLLAVAAGLAQAAKPPHPAAAPARERQADIPAPRHEQPDTIGRLAAEAGRRVGVPAANAGPVAVRPSRQVDLMVDPFEVSPQLREGRSGSRFTGLPGASVLELQRRVRVRAVLRTPQGTLAQLLINNKDVVTLMDKELIDLGDLGTYQAEILAGAVSLANPSQPQGKKVVLR